MNRREFVQATFIGGTAASALRAGLPPRNDADSAAAVPAVKLFPTELPELQWQEFRAAGFEQPVAGVIFHPSKRALLWGSPGRNQHGMHRSRCERRIWFQQRL